MSRLPYQPGQKVFFKSPILTTIATFICDDEGWPLLQFSDESWQTVRPSFVMAIDMTAFHTALGEYERRLCEGELLLIERMHSICHEMRKELGIEHSEKLHQYDQLGRALTPLSYR